MKLIERIQKIVGSKNARTAKVKKNVILAMIYRGLGIAIGFYTYSLSVSYLDVYQFGMFITLASIMDWVGYLDVGLGRGLRNKFGEALAKGDDSSGKAYVSTTFVIMGIVFSILLLVFFVANNFINWSAVLNAEASLNEDLRILALIVFTAFCLKFVFSLIFEVFNAFQRTAIVDLFNLLSKALFLIFLGFLILFAEQSILYFGAVRSIAFALIPILICFYFFRKDFKKYSPSFQEAKWEHVNELASLGLKFFIIRISLLIVNSTNNFLITQYVGNEQVTVYNSAFKYLSVVIMIFTISTKPLWAAYIEAYQRNEFDWIKNIISKLQKIWLGTLAMIVLMVALSPFVYEIWLQGKVDVPLRLTIIVAVFVLITTWIQIYNLVINGTGKIHLQLIITVISSIINIPISIFFVKVLDLGTEGIVLGSICSLLIIAIISPIQVKKILSRTDVGIWAK